MLQKEYIDAVRHNLNVLSYTPNQDPFMRNLASLNVLYYRYDLSYVYADKSEDGNKFKIGTVDPDGNVKYIGTVTKEQMFIIGLSHNSSF